MESKMEQKDFDILIDMFASDGWKFYVQSAADLEEAITKGAVDGAATNDQWQYLRGQTHQLRSILGYETYVRGALAQLEEDKEYITENVDVDII